MKHILTLSFMSIIASGLPSCSPNEPTIKNDFVWVVDRFDDIQVVKYRVNDFEKLPLQEKLFVYYLSQATISGRDIIWDQNCRHNLAIRRSLEAIYDNFDDNVVGDEWEAFVVYLKKVWFANGIHHHYSGDKFVPRFTEEYFDKLVAATPPDKFPHIYGSVDELMKIIKPVIFDPKIMAKRVNQQEGVDMVVSSANNYYEGVTQREVEGFYLAMSDKTDLQPISYGLNSKLIKNRSGLVEKRWKVGGMYSAALEKVVCWLEKAASVANTDQHKMLKTLIEHYKTGDLRKFDDFNIQWVQDTVSKVDFVNGFIETYGDPLGYKASWEGLVNIRNDKASERTAAISGVAQWFEERSPVDQRFKKSNVKGVSAKVIDVMMLGGDVSPYTAIGINLPNADWIRRDYGSKSVTIENITNAYAEAAKDNGFMGEFVLRTEDRKRIEEFGALADNLHTDLHECLGHGSGQLLPGVKGDELKNYGSTLEEARADLFALYFLADDKLLQIGVVPSKELYKAEYAKYVMAGLMTQLARVQPGMDIEEAHMRNRKLISEWVYEKGRKENVVEYVRKEEKTYVVVNDFQRLRELFGDLLGEVQRIKSEGDFEAGRNLVERYGVKVDTVLHNEVIARYAELKIVPFSGFVNPYYRPVMEGGHIVDVTVEYADSFVKQMVDYSKNYSFLPTTN